MNVAAVEIWLEAYTGLVADKLGPGQVARVARERIKVTACADADAYLALLASTPAERLKLIEGVVVPETWFFRDRGAFDGLAHHVTGLWAARHPGATFRALCVPCSSGEEAYSLAMALLIARQPASRIIVDAIDISQENIAAASAGIYRKNSFRGADLAFRGLFFDAMPNHIWRAHDAVRASVHFNQANLVAVDFTTGQQLYDAIFCRNLLIYFDRATQTRVFGVLTRLLADDGLLAVGPAEAVLALDHGYTPQPGASMFLFRKATVTSTPPPKPKAWSLPRFRSAVSPPTPAPKLPSTVQPTLPVASPLERLRSLADAGQLREAAEAGQSLLLTQGPSAELCYLLAVIAGADSDARRAEEFFRKALYLAPGHVEALMHLSLIVEQNGDAHAAAALRARAHRATALEEVVP